MANVPAYMKIMQYVLDLSIKHSDIDSRIMSERELSSHFSVARTTVRKALKSLLESNLIYVKPGRGMFVNHEKFINRGFKTYRIGFVVVDGQNVDIDNMHIGLLEQLCASLRKFPARLKMLNFSGRHMEKDEELDLYNSDAIIWVRPSLAVSDVLRKLRAKVHVESVGGLPCGDSCATTMDYFKAGRIAAEWFLKQRRRNVLFAGFRENDIVAEIYKGWRAAFSDAGSSYDERFCVERNANMENSLSDLLHSGEVDGAFSFMFVLYEVFAALAKAGISVSKDFPLMADEDFTFVPPEMPKPSAKLVMFSSQLIPLSVERIFKHLLGGGGELSEAVLEPYIEEAK